jgi:type II secretory pathway component PulF
MLSSRSGVPIVQALTVVSQTVDNSYLCKGGADARQASSAARASCVLDRRQSVYSRW